MVNAIILVNFTASAKSLLDRTLRPLAQDPNSTPFARQASSFIFPSTTSLPYKQDSLRYRWDNHRDVSYGDSLKRRRKGATSANLDLESKDFVAKLLKYGNYYENASGSDAYYPTHQLEFGVDSQL